MTTSGSASEGMEEAISYSGFREFYLKHDPVIKDLTKNLEKTQLKIIKCQLQLEFLSKCMSENLIPKGIRLKSNSHFDNRKIQSTLFKAEKTILGEIIKEQSLALKRLTKSFQNISIGLASNVPTRDFTWVTSALEQKMKCRHIEEELRLYNKFNNLKNPEDYNKIGKTCLERNQQSQRMVRQSRCNSNNLPMAPNQKGSTGFINLSSAQFTPEEAELLNFGTNFAVEDQFNPLDYISRLNSIVKNEETIHKMVDIVEERITTGNSKKFKSEHHQDLKVINKLKTDKNIKILKADKGGKMVVMDAHQYNEKMTEQIQSKYNEIPSDPTNKSIAQLRVYLKHTVGWSNSMRDDYAPLHRKTPSIHGQPKIHKEEKPLRLIISKKDSCYSELARFLAKKLTLIIEKPVSIVKNGVEFLEKIKTHPISPSSILISLDVVDMYSNININEAITALEEKIGTIDDKEFVNTVLMTKTQCIHLVTLILNNNFFSFENKMYKQNSGLAMGCSLSPMLANLVMEKIELNILNMYQLQINLWCRFMDDTFVDWRGDEKDLEPFLNRINNLHPTIKFTLEKESNNALSFLDVKITRSDNVINTAVYKKPTATEGVIHFNSYNPLSLKVSVAKQKVQRIDTYYSKADEAHRAKKEFHQVLVNNGYPNKVIRDILFSRNIQIPNQSGGNTDERQKRNYVPLQFDSSLQFKMQNRLCNEKCGIAWRQKTKTLDIYRKCRLPSKNLKLANVVYVIPCDCGQMYIGETSRPFESRLKEHKANVRLERNHSKLQQHLADNQGHEIVWDKAFVIELEKDSKIRKLKEGILIEINRDRCISDKTLETHRNWNWVIQKHKSKRSYFGIELYTL